MANSGLEDILKSALGGISRMLTEKNIPQNAKALRILCEEVLREIVKEVKTYVELMQALETRADQSNTTKFWLNSLIKPVFIMMFLV